MQCLLYDMMTWKGCGKVRSERSEQMKLRPSSCPAHLDFHNDNLLQCLTWPLGRASVDSPTPTEPLSRPSGAVRVAGRLTYGPGVARGEHRASGDRHYVSATTSQASPRGRIT